MWRPATGSVDAHVDGDWNPRGLQGRRAAAWAFCFTLWVVLHDRVRAIRCRGLDLRLFAIPNSPLCTNSVRHVKIGFPRTAQGGTHKVKAFLVSTNISPWRLLN